MHLITDFTARAGAETMLARLLSVSTEAKVSVVSLRDVSPRNRTLINNPAVSYRPLGLHSLAQAGRAIGELRSVIAAEKPDTIVCWMYHAMIAGVLAGALSGRASRVFWNVRQSLDDPSSLSRSTRIALACARRLSARPTGIIYNSQRALDLHQAYGYRNRNSIVIPNGFDLPTLELAPVRQAKVLGIAGRFHPQKDHATFFRAAALVAATHPAVRFIAVGHGVTRDNPQVAALVEASGLPLDRIELRGEATQMEPFYQEIDGLVLSSRTEGFPNVIAEAMSYGKPVVTTDVGDAAAIVSETGFICRPRDPAELAKAIRSLADLPSAEYLARAAAARRRIERSFSLEVIAARYHAFLSEGAVARELVHAGS